MMTAFDPKALRKNNKIKLDLDKTTVASVQEVIDQKIIKNPGHQITVFSAPPRARPKAPFAIVFFQTLMRSLLKNQIGIVEVKVLLLLLDTAGRENIVAYLSQKEMASKIGVTQSTISRSLKKLIEIGFLLVTLNGSHVINPHLMTRSALRTAMQTRAYKLNEELEDPLENF